MGNASATEMGNGHAAASVEQVAPRRRRWSRWPTEMCESRRCAVLVNSLCLIVPPVLETSNGDSVCSMPSTLVLNQE
jgi:hypothetical protein